MSVFKVTVEGCTRARRISRSSSKAALRSGTALSTCARSSMLYICESTGRRGESTGRRGESTGRGGESTGRGGGLAGAACCTSVADT
eukprot:6680423-Pyramimonas_sp.AAC.1